MMGFMYIIFKDGFPESYGVATGKTQLNKIAKLVKDEGCSLKVVSSPEYMRIKRRIDTKTNKRREKTFKMINRHDYMIA